MLGDIGSGERKEVDRGGGRGGGGIFQNKLSISFYFILCSVNFRLTEKVVIILHTSIYPTPGVSHC